MENSLLNNFQEWLTELGLSTILVQGVVLIVGVSVVLLLAWLADFVSKKVLFRIVSKAVLRTKTTWDDILLKERVFVRLSHLAPAIVIYYSANLIDDSLANLTGFIQSACFIYMLLMGLFVSDSLINSFHSIYQTLPIAQGRSIKGYVQVVKIIVYFIFIISILSVLLGKPLYNLLTGLGALAAVLMLVFKDTILGFVASIQLSANQMVNIGDWIVLPKYGADGDVIDISLNTVKVQNWDKTISTIPTYALVSESFQNYKGMYDSGGRRIKRHINIDMKSVCFCDADMIKRFKEIKILREYIEQKQEELDKYNADYGIDDSILVNGRRMTNLGILRKYIELYLRRHPKIKQDLTFLVRHLQPSEKGIPIEIYVFSADQVWANFESIQADIFDHLLAVIPEFNLRVFQTPTGDDLKLLSFTNK